MKSTCILFVLFLAMFISCNKKDSQVTIPPMSNYPFQTGSEWYYNKQVILREYSSESFTDLIYSDTTNYQIVVSIEKDTVLNDTMNVKVFKTIEMDRYYFFTNYAYTYYQYKFSDSTGIKDYAYLNPARPKISAKQNRFIATNNGILVNDLLCNGMVSNEGIITEPTPRLDIKLPLDENTAWTVKVPSTANKLQINKKVAGFEYLKPIVPYQCYKISSEYLYDPDFENVKVVEWVSIYGLIKRQAIFNNVMLTDESGNTIEGFFQIEENLTLKR
jgi:hypothetical protein